MLPSVMLGKRLLCAVGIALAGAAVRAAGAAASGADLVPERMAQVSRSVEQVRGRKFARAVPASRIDKAELRRVLTAKIAEGLPTGLDEYFRTLAAVGLIELSPRLTDALVDFYVSQVVAFYDSDTRRFYVAEGAEAAAGAGADTDVGQNLIFSHELTHALQDESLRLSEKVQALKEDGDRSLALQCLLEGEATLVMIRVALAALPGGGEEIEEQMGPLLTAGALERANVPKEVPDYFVEQLFFPYADGTEFVRAAVKKGGWAEVDRMWRNPPLSTSEILHGAPYPPPAQGLLPANLAGLVPGHLVYTDTLGEWSLRFLLGRALPEDEAAKAATGWRGDRIAYYASATTIGYWWKLRFEDGAAAARFEAALRKARAARPVATPETIRADGPDVLVTAGTK